jgi:hypothetical protein
MPFSWAGALSANSSRPPLPQPDKMLHGETPALLPTHNPRVIFKTLAKGAVLYNPTDESYFGLNPVGVRIWELLPPVSERLEDVCLVLGREFPDVAPEVIRVDVLELLEELTRMDLVQPRSAGAARAS